MASGLSCDEAIPARSNEGLFPGEIFAAAIMRNCNFLMDRALFARRQLNLSGLRAEMRYWFGNIELVLKRVTYALGMLAH